MTVTETIDKKIEELVEQLPGADAPEVARIHNRIYELEKIKKGHTTT